MDFLACCQRLRSEAGIAGSGPSTVINQTGELGRIVGWVRDAYQDILDKNPNWWFLQSEFSFDCTIGQAKYPKSTVAGLANWKMPTDSDGFRCSLTTLDDEQWLIYQDWDTFRGSRLRGSNRTATGRPIDYTITPDKQLQLWPLPDDVYTIDGECYITGTPFSNDTDVPVFDRFHMAIVYNALMRYAAYSAEPALFAYAQNQYGRLINKLELDQREAITLGEALA